MDLVSVADSWEENQECLKQQLGESLHGAFGARWVLMPAVPYPRFNHVSCIRLDHEQIPDLIAAARTFYGARGLPSYSLLTTPATQPNDLGVHLYRKGFVAETNPVLIWGGSPLPAVNGDLRVEQVGPEQAETFWSLLRTVFYAGTSAEVKALGRRGVELSFGIGVLNFIAYLGGRPVGAGSLFPRGSMGGIYNMCTLPRYQRRGVATAVLTTAIDRAQALGCSHVGLTTTPDGLPLYERMGFREAYREIYFSHRIP